MLSFGVITKVNTLVRQRQKEMNNLVADWGGGVGWGGQVNCSLLPSACKKGIENNDHQK